MQIYDCIKSIKEVPYLAERGIHKGCRGKILDIEGTRLKIVFWNPRIHGDYAIVWVNEDDIAFSYRQDDEFLEITKANVHKFDESKHTSLIEADVYEYDWVKLIVEKEKYAKYGVHKGMEGCVLMPDSYDNEWYVEFSKEDGSGEVLADLCVAREDFVITERANIQ